MAITSELFQQLIGLEMRYAQGNITYDLIQILIDLYAKCIEHYDSIQDPVGVYFNEKLQFLFTNQSALQSIRKINDKQENIDLKQSPQQNTQKSAKIVSVEVLKKEQQTKAKIAMEVEDQTQNTQDSLETMIKGYQQTQNQTAKVITSDLQKQEDKILERMKKRQESKRQLFGRTSAQALSGSVVSSVDKLDVYETENNQSVQPSYFQDMDFKKNSQTPIRESVEQQEESEHKNIVTQQFQFDQEQSTQIGQLIPENMNE